MRMNRDARTLLRSYTKVGNELARRGIIVLAMVAIAAVNWTAFAFAQSGPPPGGQIPDLKTLLAGPPPILSIDRPQANTKGTLQVSSSSFAANGEIPLKYTAYAESISPDISWSAGPQGTRSYVLILEDATFGMDRKGNLHWLVFNIAPEVTKLPEGLKRIPEGMIVACCVPHNSHDGVSTYVGPHAPAGVPAFHYSFQVFALDTTLNLTLKATREAVWDAMNGHVLAKGSLTGTFQGPAKQAQ